MTTDPPVVAPSATEDGRAKLRRALGSVRVRVVVGYVGLLLLALVIGLLITRQLLFTRLDRQIERDLAQEVAEVGELATGNDPDTGQPFNDDTAPIFRTFLRRNVPLDGEAYFTLVGGEPSQFTIDPPAQLLDDGPLVRRWAALDAPLRLDVSTADAGEARTLAVPLRTSDGTSGVFVVAAFPREAQAELNDALRIIATASGLVLAISAAVAWSLAARVVRPVRELTATAQQMSDSDLSARIPVEGHDELAELGQTFNDLLDRVETGMRGQREFLDDVAHELRVGHEGDGLLVVVAAAGHLEVTAHDGHPPRPGGHPVTRILIAEDSPIPTMPRPPARPGASSRQGSARWVTQNR